MALLIVVRMGVGGHYVDSGLAALSIGIICSLKSTSCLMRLRLLLCPPCFTLQLCLSILAAVYQHEQSRTSLHTESCFLPQEEPSD